eukprot:208095-Prorocentrum_minimum.AAC.2
MFNRNYLEDCINLRAAKNVYSLIHLLYTLITYPLTSCVRCQRCGSESALTTYVAFRLSVSACLRWGPTRQTRSAPASPPLGSSASGWEGSDSNSHRYGKTGQIKIK